jgi:UMF1 family MFS transporter
MPMSASEVSIPAKKVSPAARLSWAMFEWGRNPSFTLISIFIFAPYFSQEIVGDPVRGQALWADIQMYTGFMVAASVPFLAAIAEAGGPRKPWVAFFTFTLALACASLWFALPNNMGLSIFAIGLLVAINNFAYDSTIVFHGAMLSSLTTEERIGRLSGLGYGLGNVATFLLLTFFLVFIALPERPLFGLDRATHEEARIVGPIAAIWMLVFALPFFLNTPDRAPNNLPISQVVRNGLRSLGHTLGNVGHYSNVAKYLLARMVYNDGLNMMLGFGGVYASGVFGWSITETGIYGLMVIPFAALGSFLGGALADRIGPKRALQITLTGTIFFGFLTLGFAPDRWLFVLPYEIGHAVMSLPFFETLPELLYLLTVCFDAVFLVASYANSRTMMARIAPEARMTEFFGLYTMSGEATAFATPLAIGIVTRATESQQWGIAAILVFIAAGLAGLSLVREERAALASEPS